ncbi:MAG TPA: PBP1A family penicillin-binding protein [Bryobacteraceae bacterium]|nr:PBP1A family penicillin-binding protein [Bryobacteraceae bacterium]
MTAALLVVAAHAFVSLSRYLDVALLDGFSGRGTVYYSAPRVLTPGDQVMADDIVSALRAAGYSENSSNAIGSYEAKGRTLSIVPGPASYFRSEPVRVNFDNGTVSKLLLASTGQEIQSYALEPQPLGMIADGAVQRRTPYAFDEIPPNVVNAMLSAEDKNFFRHFGFDPLRVAKAVWVNSKSRRRAQGGSTLTMQLARNLYLDADKTWLRKAKELVIAEMLEIKLSKQEIFEHYINQVYLGRRDTMEVRGFGQAARTYFGKDLRKLSLGEAALLAGIIQRPSYFDPVRHPERALGRRNVVLRMMAQNEFISAAERVTASAEPLVLAPRTPAASDNAWFLDLASEEFSDSDTVVGGARVYTTIDPYLQRAASAAVERGMQLVDAQLRGRRTKAAPQVALVAIDSHTGEVKALIGGRDFGASQLNRAVALRQPGSVFKPFVYAAALSPQQGKQAEFTPASTVTDQPTTFRFAGQSYTPSNFGDQFYGRVSLRKALAKSMNIATVSVAERVGYRRVLDVATESGLNGKMRATPSLALGAYEATPLEMAASYSVFANAGVAVQPTFIAEVRAPGGALHRRKDPRQGRRVLDPQVAFVMQDMLSEVVRSGTAAKVRSEGFHVPAAGKTGTSRDGWFVGYTSNLICAVWVGYDDGSDLDLEGAKSALPIWTAFMKAAARRQPYRQDLGDAPSGVVTLSVDSNTGLIADASCPNSRREVFVAGTEPRSRCNHGAVQAESTDESSSEGSPVATAIWSGGSESD